MPSWRRFRDAEITARTSLGALWNAGITARRKPYDISKRNNDRTEACAAIGACRNVRAVVRAAICACGDDGTGSDAVISAAEKWLAPLGRADFGG